MKTSTATRILWSVLAGTVFVPLFTLVAAGVYGSIQWDGLANSDLLQPFLVTRDALIDPSNLLDWYHSPSIYVFPDWIIAAFIQIAFVPASHGLMVLIYSGAILSLYVIAFAWLMRSANICPFPLALVYASVVVLMVLCATLLPGHGIADTMTMLLGTAYIHTGAIAFGIALCTGVLEVFKEDQTSRRLLSNPTVFSSTAAFLICYSDPVAMPWFVAPSLATMVIVSTLRRSRPPVLKLAAIFLGALAGALVDRATRPFPVEIFSSVEAIPKALAELVRSSAAQGDILLFVSLLLVAVMAVRAIWILWRCFKERSISIERMAELLLVACTWASLLTPIVSGALVHPSLIRYALPIFFLPYLWLALIAVEVMPDKLFPSAAGLAVVVWIVVLSSNWTAIIQGAGYYSRQTDLASCLLDKGLQHGYSDYWNSKRTMWLSGYKLHLVQLDDALEPLRYNFNERWFTQTANGEPFRPNFVLPQRLNEDALRAKFGTPTSILECSRQPVWLYDTIK